MLRPTPGELLGGLARAVQQTMLPELRSPYAVSQAMSMIGDLLFAASAAERARWYDAGEEKDLRRTLIALSRRAGTGDAVATAVERGAAAASQSPPDRRAMEAAISELAAALAVHQLARGPARTVRGYLRRHLARMREYLTNASPSQAATATPD
ncbi:MAG: hypothetical protein ACREQB_00920 [Candidatus Binataceae bacterium]